MKIKEILIQLQYNNGTFPREALLEAIENRDAIIPELLKILEYSTENIESLIEDHRYFAHLYAMYLLAQFREKRAYKLLIELLSIPGEMIHEFIGDVITEDLCRILTSVYDGNIDLLKAIIENENLNEYVRTAALETISLLVVTGEKERKEIIDYFQELFNGKLEREFSHVWNALVRVSTKLYPEELYDDIKKTYDDDLIESFFIRLEDVEETLKIGKEQVLSKLTNERRSRLIDDTISELEHWACFNKQKRKQRLRPSNTPTTPIAKPKKIGRNEPCPCGSGKKYKKCCLK